MFTRFNVQKHIIFLLDWLVMNMKHVLPSGKCQSAMDQAFFLHHPALKHRSGKGSRCKPSAPNQQSQIQFDNRRTSSSGAIQAFHHTPDDTLLLPAVPFYKQGNLRQTVQHPSVWAVCVVILAPWTLPTLASKNKFCPRAIIRAALW